MKKQRAFTQLNSCKANLTGFTVIELLVVIAIIGLLSSIVLVSTKEAKEKAKMAKAFSFSAQVHHALGAYAIGIWDFDDGTGDEAKDSSGYENDGTLDEGDSGGAVCAQGGACPDWTDEGDTPTSKGYALSFDGVDDYVDCGNDSVLRPTDMVTVAVWAKINSFVDWSSLVSYAEDTGSTESGYDLMMLTQNLGWGIPDDSIVFRVKTDDVYMGGNEWNPGYTPGVDDIYTFSPVSEGEWHHIVGTYNGSEIKLYIDGKEEDSVSIEGDIDWDPEGGPFSNLYLGAFHDDYGTPEHIYFDGLLDQVRIYDQALTSAQIKKLYAEGAEKHGLLAKE